MFICQSIKRLASQRLWRVVIYKVVENSSGQLVWMRHSGGEWYSDKWIENPPNSRWIHGDVVARMSRNKDIPVYDVENHTRVSQWHAMKITQIKGPMAFDWIRDNNSPDSEEIQNVIPKKPVKEPKPPKPEPTPEEIAQQQIVVVDERLARFNRKIKFYETLIRKNQRRRNNLLKKARSALTKDLP